MIVCSLGHSFLLFLCYQHIRYLLVGRLFAIFPCSCAVLCFSWETLVCRCSSFFVCMMFIFSVRKQWPRRSYHFHFCDTCWIFILHSQLFVLVDCSCFMLVLVSRVLHIRYLYGVCYLSFCRMSVLCCAFVEQHLPVVFPSCEYDVRTSQVARIMLIYVVLFVFPFCTVTCS